MKRLSRLEPRTFLTGTRALTTRSPTLYRLSYGIGNVAAYAILILQGAKLMTVPDIADTHFGREMVFQDYGCRRSADFLLRPTCDFAGRSSRRV